MVSWMYQVGTCRLVRGCCSWGRCCLAGLGCGRGEGHGGEGSRLLASNRWRARRAALPAPPPADRAPPGPRLGPPPPRPRHRSVAARAGWCPPTCPRCPPQSTAPLQRPLPTSPDGARVGAGCRRGPALWQWQRCVGVPAPHEADRPLCPLCPLPSLDMGRQVPACVWTQAAAHAAARVDLQRPPAAPHRQADREWKAWWDVNAGARHSKGRLGKGVG